MNNIYIIGGANIDIQGITKTDIRLNDSNIGKITYSYGGVGRNIADNLAQLGHPIYFITVFSKDAFGQQLMDNCHKRKIDISLSIISETAASSTYLAILDDNHDMLVGVADMDILKLLNEHHINELLLKIDKNDMVVLDTNLEKQIINHILTSVSCPVFVDPISTTKAEKLRDELKHITMLKPNRLEAESLCGFKIIDATTGYQALDFFLSHGIKEIVITLGKDGILASDNEEYLWAHIPITEIVCATGAGDAFIAGYIDGYKRKEAIRQRIIRASVMSELTLATQKTVSDDIDVDMINEMIHDYPIIFEEL